jgi:hypothetical protein
MGIMPLPELRRRVLGLNRKNLPGNIEALLTRVIAEECLNWCRMAST